MRFLLNGRLFWGLLVVAGGVVLLAYQFGLIDLDIAYLITHLWPVVLIYFGVAGLIEAVSRAGRDDRGQTRGLLLGTALINGVIAAAGVVQLGHLNGLWATNATWLWSLVLPGALIVGGVHLLQGGLQRPGARTHWAVMGGGKLGRGAWQLSDLAVVSVMGGAEIDLSQAILPESGDVQIDLWSIMGGSTLRLPPHLSFTLEEVAIMGGTRADGGSATHPAAAPAVRIRSFSFMGGSKIVRE